jgi:asparagine synthase (glutamine-hydrolysing)
MTDAVAHRGPDAGAILVEGNVAFGHRRLSIIDLSESSNQPFVDNTGRYVMVYNGEIYNYREVKNMLPAYPFRTAGDTELVLAAFITWGKDGFSRLKGMFAISIYDRIDKKMILVRDRFGVKPLYYHYQSGNLIFSSEIRAILASGLVSATLNKDGLYEYLSYQSVGSPLTLVEGIHQLEAGTCMEITQSGTSVSRWWNLLEGLPEVRPSAPSAIKLKIRELMFSAVEQRLVADVPVGAFLSGGIDSSAVVAIMAEVGKTTANTFNVYFDEEEYDESKYAELVARKYNTTHTPIHLRPDDFLHQLVPALRAMDTPSGDGVNTYVVSKAIRNAGMTVALSGIGGDELFAGYPIFSQYLKLNSYKQIWKAAWPFRKLAAIAYGGKSSTQQRMQQILQMDHVSIDMFYPSSRVILTKQQIQRYTGLVSRITSLEKELEREAQGMAKLPLLSQVSVAEYKGYTQHTLLKDADQMSMATALEVREPFFDHELIQYVLAIPDSVKFPSYPKQLLVESLQGMLPDEIVHRKKKGFNFPWKIWLRSELRSFAQERITAVCDRGIVHEDHLMTTWKKFVSGDEQVRWAEMWLFIVLEEWLRNNDVKA